MMLKVTIGAALLGVAVRTVLHHTPAKPLHPSAQPPPSIIESGRERAPCAPASALTVAIQSPARRDSADPAPPVYAPQAGHGSMITPPPRSAHGQKYDAANECSCRERGDCYSNITEGAQYCGVGCVGEACLYYQIGCFAGCGTCSYSGKDLYPTPEDLQLADNCQPIEPTLPVEFRSYNIDDESSKGDWTKVNPWRAPGTAGRGNPAFQPCGVNSGWRSATPVRGSAGPPTSTEPIGANGTDLPPVGPPTVWQHGKTAEVEFSIYANHAGGVSVTLSARFV